MLLKKFSEYLIVEGCCECPYYNAGNEFCEHPDLDKPQKILSYTEARMVYFGFAEWCLLEDYEDS